MSKLAGYLSTIAANFTSTLESSQLFSMGLEGQLLLSLLSQYNSEDDGQEHNQPN